MPSAPIVLIKSAADIGSAVAHTLKQAGMNPVLLESAEPGVTRRLMAFAAAVFSGKSEMAGLRAVRCASEQEARACWAHPDEIPLLVGDLDAPPPFPVDVMVDARMRKKLSPPSQITLAPLVIGLGPGFEAGVNVHVVIETNWGEHLGHVITQGRAEAYTGRHRDVRGYSSQRYIYAPAAGVFHTELDILTPVSTGQAVGHVDDIPLYAEVAGLLRGLAYPGRRVAQGAKLVEVDPTADPDNCRGIGVRQQRIAQGVLEAIQSSQVQP